MERVNDEMELGKDYRWIGMMCGDSVNILEVRKVSVRLKI